MTPLRALAPAFAVLLAGCAATPDPATPAFWQVDCPGARQAWLFGTVHALERPAQWRGEIVDKAMEESSLLMVELADPGNAKAGAQVWDRLAKGPDQGLLSARMAPEQRSGLAKVLDRTGLDDDQFTEVDTWAAALTIAQAASRHLDSGNGIDGAVLKAMKGTPVAELEGREAQLAIFDRLPESEQRDLLATVVADAGRSRDEASDIAAAWRRGDMTIARATEQGMLSDPQFREALFTGRNRRWTRRVLEAMDKGERPFVAVGAAHLAGPQGLPAMLRASGCAVERAQ
ncbi:MAG: TraB/GumN family protein [Alphaproteobacteria bacterium]|nr:TraB/GumN family protein [Alphaproteobacteria bacterium]